jgi:CHAT domain-containing protein
VHLACHGLVDVRVPANSALALTPGPDADGLLTIPEIFRLRIPADLVVLSACETAKGKVYKAEGVIGLTRAFMMAGTPRVLCSLWNVDDAATQALMVRFYELWNPAEGEGLPAAAALARAQDHVRSQEQWRHPYYWAAWVLWGLGD